MGLESDMQLCCNKNDPVYHLACKYEFCMPMIQVTMLNLNIHLLFSRLVLYHAGTVCYIILACFVNASIWFNQINLFHGASFDTEPNPS